MNTTHNKTFYHMTLKATCGLILDALTGVTIADCRNESDAAEIVSRCNSHDELVQVLKGILPIFQRLIERHEPDNVDNEWIAHAREAIAHAEGH